MRSPGRDISPDGLWVESGVLPDGTYGASVAVGPDRCWALDHDQSIQYALTCFRRAAEAEHDVAVFALLTHRFGVDVRDSTTFVAHIVLDRLDDVTDTVVPGTPLRFLSAMGANGEPVVMVELDGRVVGQLTPDGAREHAAAVLVASNIATLDTALHRALTETVSLCDREAHVFVSSLPTYRQDPPVPS